jgi:hypothetical protein
MSQFFYWKLSGQAVYDKNDFIDKTNRFFLNLGKMLKKEKKKKVTLPIILPNFTFMSISGAIH